MWAHAPGHQRWPWKIPDFPEAPHMTHTKAWATHEVMAF